MRLQTDPATRPTRTPRLIDARASRGSARGRAIPHVETRAVKVAGQLAAEQRPVLHAPGGMGTAQADSVQSALDSAHGDLAAVDLGGDEIALGQIVVAADRVRDRISSLGVPSGRALVCIVFGIFHGGAA